jgi:hypothetical protein
MEPKKRKREKTLHRLCKRKRKTLHNSVALHPQGMNEFPVGRVWGAVDTAQHLQLATRTYVHYTGLCPPVCMCSIGSIAAFLPLPLPVPTSQEANWYAMLAGLPAAPKSPDRRAPAGCLIIEHSKTALTPLHACLHLVP